ncbi:MAG: CBS domain-containing protein [Burkholderiales bacterium]|nr:CBS domain-containing protein [Burkholderiales bacterium]OJX06019.1 MAG: hypothetical protein BGO72_05075 [Burkholderiales bacterium 70-64]
MISPTLRAGVAQFLRAHAPFSMMSDDDLEFVARHVELAYYARGETLIGPDDGPPRACFILKQGLVEGLRRQPGRPDSDPEPMVQRVPGEMLPVSALMAARPVMSTYRAAGDVFCWVLPKAQFDELQGRSPVFLDFCKRRMASLLELSHQSLQASYAAQATQWRTIEAPLESMLRRAPVTCGPDESLRAVFERMERERVGAIVVTTLAPGGGEQVQGIFTRHDVLDRVVLPGLSLETPVRAVMSAPVVTLDARQSVGDAMLRMSDRTIRHIPVMRDGRLAGVVAERDLFVLQRRSMQQIGDAIGRAHSVAELQLPAAEIRQWSFGLVAQGVSASFITRLVSRLDDQLTARLLELKAAEHAVGLDRLCWLALGSQGREEQIAASGQDNALIVAEAAAPQEREAMEAFARDVNAALTACGHPSGRSGIVAGSPHWCLDPAQWRALVEGWIEGDGPEAPREAGVFLDFRPVAGAAALAQALREHVAERAAAAPRFLQRMRTAALRHAPPQSWSAGVLDALFGAQAAHIDLEAHGTTPLVDAARVFALTRGVRATGTVERLEALAADGVLAAEEARAWIDSFRYLQGLRLRARQEGAAPPPDDPDVLDTRTLSTLDRRILKEAFREVRRMQQRLAAHFPG